METANQFTQTASQLYQVATNVAHRAGEAASTARDKLREWKHQEFRFNEWQKRMSNTHPEIWSLVFIVVCICEYYFSRELYRDFMPDAPLVPAIGMIFLDETVSASMLAGGVIALAGVAMVHGRGERSPGG